MLLYILLFDNNIVLFYCLPWETALSQGCRGEPAPYHLNFRPRWTPDSRENTKHESNGLIPKKSEQRIADQWWHYHRCYS